ncbi:MAG: hypothetical protein LBR75_03880 [Prevotellaceae bacterium]|jgi:uncharacterized protein (TIGR00661 family)|nr:hypothetical protein [Prevotellaceae bacterium]
MIRIKADCKHVLIAPLNWGLGHASRCIPVVYDLLRQGYWVVIAADGLSLELLRQEFPELPFVVFPSFKIRYGAGKSQVWAMVRSLPKIVYGIVKENRLLQRIIRRESIDFVISDNRFGLWTRQVPCAYITHQLMIKMPRGLKFLEPLAWRLHRFVINRYAECWIPDVEGAPNLSGDLAHKYPLPPNVRFIGALSRFSTTKDIIPVKTYHTLVLISGVEPHRSLFEKEQIEKLKGSEKSVLIVQGLPGKEPKAIEIENITIISHLDSEELKAQLLAAEEIVCRSGYSTLMDLHALGRKATLVATPGQTEQEYLAELHKNGD